MIFERKNGDLIMKEDICSIPINDIFNIKDGCPICRMRNDLENRALNFVLGPAMMEPDVRKETNQYGFCSDHFKMMFERKNRLQLALILESHLQKISDDIFAKHKPGLLKKPAAAANDSAEEARKMEDSCYVCERTGRSLDKALNTFFVMWKKDEQFRNNVKEQPYYCLKDYAYLIKRGEKALNKNEFTQFYCDLSNCAKNGVDKLKSDVSGFCRMYDYHNNGESFGELRDAVNNSIKYFTGKELK